MDAVETPDSESPEVAFPRLRILEVVSEHEKLFDVLRADIGMTDAIYSTEFWSYYPGFRARTDATFKWSFNGTEQQVNRYRKMVRTYLGDLYPRSARVTLDPDPHGRGDPAVTSAVLNEWWRKPYAYPTVNDACLMALTFPGSGLKVGYDPGTRSPLERTWLRPIPPWELVLDRDAPSVEDERYRGHLYQAPIQDVLRRYPKLRGMRLIGGQRRDYLSDGFKPETTLDIGMIATTTVGEFVRVLEFNNLRDNYVSESGQVYEGRLEVWILDQSKEISGCPVFCGPLPFEDADGRSLPNVEPLIFDHEIGFPFRALAPTKATIPQQVELNLMRTAAAGDIRRNARHFMFRQGAISQDALVKMLNGADGEGVEVPPGVPFNEVFAPIPPQEIQSDTLAYMAQVDVDLTGQLGPSRNAQGQSEKITAFQSELIQKHVEADLQFHGILLVGCLARVSRLAQCAIRLAAMHAGDSEGGTEPVVDPVVATDVVRDGGEPVAVAVESPKTTPVHTFKSFTIKSGDQTFEVTDDALVGDFAITFVDADTTPVNRQAVLQFMTGPGFESYMKMWDLVQKGGPIGMVAERGMRKIAETMNLPRDMHPDAMLADLKKQEAAKKPKAPPKAVAGRPATPPPPPIAEATPAEPPSANPEAEQGVAVVTETLTGAIAALEPLGEQAGAAVAALTMAVDAAKAGDLGGLAAAVSDAVSALPPETPPEVAEMLTTMQGQIESASQA